MDESGTVVSVAVFLRDFAQASELFEINLGRRSAAALLRHGDVLTGKARRQRWRKTASASDFWNDSSSDGPAYDVLP